MSRMLCAWVGFALLVGVGITGCGDSGSSGSGETTVATTTSTTGNERLTSAQWAQYETSAAALRKANTAATATLKKCSANSVSQNTARLQACVGDTFTQLTSAATASLGVLNGFDNTVSGSCASSLDDLTNYVGTFQASAAEMQRTIDSATLAGYPAASQNLEQALTSGKSEAQTFEQECAPS